jgi:hypothetical protein
LTKKLSLFSQGSSETIVFFYPMKKRASKKAGASSGEDTVALVHNEKIGFHKQKCIGKSLHNARCTGVLSAADYTALWPEAIRILEQVAISIHELPRVTLPAPISHQPKGRHLSSPHHCADSPRYQLRDRKPAHRSDDDEQHPPPKRRKPKRHPKMAVTAPKANAITKAQPHKVYFKRERREERDTERDRETERVRQRE